MAIKEPLKPIDDRILYRIMVTTHKVNKVTGRIKWRLKNVLPL